VVLTGDVGNAPQFANGFLGMTKLQPKLGALNPDGIGELYSRSFHTTLSTVI